jgi:hypothetical protein
MISQWIRYECLVLYVVGGWMDGCGKCFLCRQRGCIDWQQNEVTLSACNG